MERWRNFKKIFKVSLFFVFLLLWGLSDISLSQSRLDIPTANLEIKNAVPLPLITKIANVKTKEVWGNGALGASVALSDLDGNIIVYMFSFYIGGEKFPAYEEIFQEIKKGRELRDNIKNSQIEKAKEMYMKMDNVKAEHPRIIVVSNSEIPARPPMDPVRPDGSPSRRNELKKISKFASDKAMGAGEFGTIFVSATYDIFPVLAYFHYLAPYYINFDLSLEKAEKVIGQGAFLKRIYFLGLEGQYFEFENNGNSITLNSKTLETTTIDALKKSRISDIQIPSSDLISSRDKIKADISEEWEKIKAETGRE